MTDNMNTENVTAPKTNSTTTLVYVQTTIELPEGEVKAVGGVRLDRNLVDSYLEKIAKSAILKALAE